MARLVTSDQAGRRAQRPDPGRDGGDAGIGEVREQAPQRRGRHDDVGVHEGDVRRGAGAEPAVAGRGRARATPGGAAPVRRGARTGPRAPRPSADPSSTTSSGDPGPAAATDVEAPVELGEAVAHRHDDGQLGGRRRRRPDAPRASRRRAAAGRGARRPGPRPTGAGARHPAIARGAAVGEASRPAWASRRPACCPPRARARPGWSVDDEVRGRCGVRRRWDGRGASGRLRATRVDARGEVGDQPREERAALLGATPRVASPSTPFGRDRPHAARPQRAAAAPRAARSPRPAAPAARAPARSRASARSRCARRGRRRPARRLPPARRRGPRRAAGPSRARSGVGVATVPRGEHDARRNASALRTSSTSASLERVLPERQRAREARVLAARAVRQRRRRRPRRRARAPPPRPARSRSACPSPSAGAGRAARSRRAGARATGAGVRAELRPGARRQAHPWLTTSSGCAQPALEARRDEDVRRAEVRDGGVAEPEQRRVDAAAQDVQHVLDAGLAVGGQAPEVRRARSSPRAPRARGP